VGVTIDPSAVLAFDPRERAVLCAIGPDGQVHGLGAMHLHRGAQPDLVLVDETGGEALRELLCDTLAARLATARGGVRPRSTAPVRALRSMARRARRPGA
jgi:hypothetical protein